MPPLFCNLCSSEEDYELVSGIAQSGHDLPRPCPIGSFRRSHNSLFHVKCQLNQFPKQGAKHQIACSGVRATRVSPNDLTPRIPISEELLGIIGDYFHSSALVDVMRVRGLDTRMGKMKAWTPTEGPGHVKAESRSLVAL